MKKILTTAVMGGAMLGALFIPMAVTHASYYNNSNMYYNMMPYQYSYNNNYDTSSNNGFNYSYNYGYNYNQPSYNNYNYNSTNGYYNYNNNNQNYNSNYNRGSYYNNYSSNNNWNNYSSSYNNYPVYQTPVVTVSHICGPDSTYDPINNDCQCYSGYISQNNICVIQPIVYSNNDNYDGIYNLYGNLKPIAVCNDGTVSYSPVGTCWINGGVQSWTS